MKRQKRTCRNNKKPYNCRVYYLKYGTMTALNRFDFIGRLTKNPEVKTSQAGKDRTLLTLAQDKTWKDANGEKQKKGLFFQFVAYGKI